MIYSLMVTNSIGESMTFELSNPMRSGHAVRLIDGVGTPDMNVNSTPYGIGDGSVLGSIKAEYRLITISLWPLKHPTVETSRQRLYRFFQVKKLIVLTFVTENRTVWIDGYIQKIGPNIFENPETVDIEVKCLYPYFRKMNEDQTGFYGIQPEFEFIFSSEFEFIDGVSWRIGDMSNTMRWDDFLYAGDRYIAVGQGDPNSSFKYSYGGYDWKNFDAPISKSTYWSSIAKNDERVVSLMRNSSLIWTKEIEKLDDEWEIQGLPFNANWESVIFGEDKFVALCSDVAKGAYSQDGIEWTEMSTNIRGNWKKLVYGNGYFVAFEPDSIIGIYSSDGINWDILVFPEEGPYHDVAFGNGIFLFTRSNHGNWLRTVDPARLMAVNQPDVEYPFRVGFANGYFIAIKEKSDFAYWSSDGVRWGECRMPFVDDWKLIGPGEVNEETEKIAAFSSIGNVTISDRGYRMIDPVEFSYFTIDNRMTIDYKGEIDAGIKITIECQEPPGDIMIYNVDTLEYIEIFSDRIKTVTGGELTIKDIIEISTESGQKYVRLLRDGVYYNILGAMNRNMTWFILKQGPNVFTYTTSNEHAAIIMTFSYNDTYAAI